MQREDLKWGIRLIDKPISKRPSLIMEVHIHTGKKPPTIGLLFTGALGTPLTKGESNLWVNHLRGLLDHAEELCQEMK